MDKEIERLDDMQHLLERMLSIEERRKKHESKLIDELILSSLYPEMITYNEDLVRHMTIFFGALAILTLYMRFI